MTLGELAEKLGGLIQTGPFGSQLHESDYQEVGIPVIMPKDIVGNAVDEGGIARISEATAVRLKKHRVKAGDIVLPRRGDITKRAFIKKDHAGFLCGTGCIKLSFDEKNISSLYLNYYLAKSDVIGWLENNSVGSTMKNLSGSILKNLPVELPPLLTQRRIASILSAYDDLIENNLRRIKLLEELAQRTYEEWFVRLRFPGYETAVFDEETGLPEGWERKPLNSIIEIISGYPFKSSLYVKDGKFQIVTIKNVQDGFFLTNTTDSVLEIPVKLKEEQRLKTGDIIISLTGNVGRTCLVFGDNYLLNQRVAQIRLINESYKAFVYFYLRSKPSVTMMENLSNGTAQQNLSPIKLGLHEVVLPSNEVMTLFGIVFNDFVTNMCNYYLQNQLLVEARESLLPKLMSGELATEGDAK